MLPGCPPLFGVNSVSFIVPITTNQTEYNLRAVLLASPYFWDGTTPCIVTNNISAGVVLGSLNRSSTAGSAAVGSWMPGGSYPAGSEIDLNIASGARIQGYGGNGGPGGGAVGGYGGHAIYLPASMGAVLKINNLGAIWGGGGGGASSSGSAGGAGAGGGAGTAVGLGSAAQPEIVPYGATDGGNGTATAGGGPGGEAAYTPEAGITTTGFSGAGGNPGLAGGGSSDDGSNVNQPGGPAGHAVLLNGNASPTFITTGDVRGPIS